MNATQLNEQFVRNTVKSLGGKVSCRRLPLGKAITVIIGEATLLFQSWADASKVLSERTAFPAGVYDVPVQGMFGPANLSF